jgi:hypothetical protein
MSRTLPVVLLLDPDDTILDNSGARDDAWRQACISAAETRPGNLWRVLSWSF